MSQTLTEDPSLSIGLEGDVPNEPDDTGARLSHRAEQVGQAATQTGRKIADYVSHKAHDATSSVGEGLKSLGDTVRDKTPSGAATSAVADSLEHAGRYLQEEGLSGAAQDLTGLIRRNPIPALLVGIGFGFLIAQATAPRRS